MKRMNAKQYLNQGYRLNEIIESDKAELAMLDAAKDGMRSMHLEQDKVSSGKVSSQVEDTVMRIEALKEKIDREMNRYIRIREEIRDEIEKQISDPTEKLILRYRYVLFYKWEQIFRAVHLEKSQTHNIHLTALNHFRVPDHKSPD